MVEPGTILLGKYRIERILGQGGMGVVALAHHLHLDEPMAIKFLQPNALKKDEVVQRFLREAQAAVKLKGEHICRVFDVGTLESGSPYMVMEYLRGIDLGQFLRKHGVPPIAVTVDIMLQACEALAEAHAFGIVHRDVKPANFFLTQRTDGSPLVKLLDFGISKPTTQVDVELTNTQATLGTPAYMSPEQLRSSKNVDERTDIWALGVILYELSSGRRPFKAETFSALCLKVAMEPPPPLSVPLPPGLEQVLMRCLQKDPAYRFQTVTELAAALEPYHLQGGLPSSRRARAASVLGSTGDGVAIGDAGQGHNVAAAMPTTTLSVGAGHVDARGKRRGGYGWLLAGLAAALVGVGIGAAVVMSGDGSDAEDSGSSMSAAAATPVMVETAIDAPTTEDAAAATAGDVAEVAEPELEIEPAEPAEPVKTKYVIASEPDGASVLFDGRRVGETPFEAELAEGETQRYELERKGYQTASVMLPEAAGEDGTAQVRLERKPRSSKASGSKKKSKKPTLDKGETLGWD